MIRWISDQILSFLQRRCPHPGEMVAVDILEGSGDYEIAYCRRCGAISPTLALAANPASRERREWRRPDRNLWRG